MTLTGISDEKVRRIRPNVRFCSNSTVVTKLGEVRGKEDTQIFTAVGDLQPNAIKVVGTGYRRHSSIGDLKDTTFGDIERKVVVLTPIRKRIQIMLK